MILFIFFKVYPAVSNKSKPFTFLGGGMSLLKTEWIKKDDLDFKYKIYVNKAGEFTTTLPFEISKLFLDANIRMDTNRAGNDGYFYADSLSGLNNKIHEIIEEYHSRELVSKKTVIRYIIQTTCLYCLDPDGNPVPNGQSRWTKTEDYRWINGTIDQDATHPEAYGIRIFAAPSIKEVYKYKSGTTKEEYHRVDNPKEGTHLDWLVSFCSMRPPEGEDLKEIDYTESTAKFFVDLLLSICRINESIKDKLEPDKIQIIIDNKQKLLN